MVSLAKQDLEHSLFLMESVTVAHVVVNAKINLNCFNLHPSNSDSESSLTIRKGSVANSKMSRNAAFCSGDNNVNYAFQYSFHLFDNVENIWNGGRAARSVAATVVWLTPIMQPIDQENLMCVQCEIQRHLWDAPTGWRRREDRRLPRVARRWDANCSFIWPYHLLLPFISGDLQCPGNHQLYQHITLRLYH